MLDTPENNGERSERWHSEKRHAKNMIISTPIFSAIWGKQVFLFRMSPAATRTWRMGHVLVHDVHGPQRAFFERSFFWTLPSNDHRIESIWNLQSGFNFNRQAQQRLSTSACFNCKRKSRIARMIHADRIPKQFHPNGISIAFYMQRG